jgi:sulfur-oxidizing protein SoxZ
MARTLITIPPTAKRDEIIEIRVLIQHPMETGYRRSSEGAMLARDLIRRFTCTFEEKANAGKRETIFSARLFAAIAANPYLSFHTVALTSGVFILTWEGDNGFAQTERASLNVV